MPDGAESLRIEPLAPANRDAAIALAREAWEGPMDDAYLTWRYRSAPTQEAVLALVGDACVAMMFALRRSYRTPDGDREVLEPFSWHAAPEWRARGAGLRVVRHWMAGNRPLVALGGTGIATRMFERMRWSPLGVGGCFVLPLHAPFLRARGRGPGFAALFEWVGRHYFRPRAGSGAVVAHLVDEPGPSASRIAMEQRRFGWMRLPDALTWRWLASAPAPLGRYLAFHLHVDGETVGWATARTHRSGGAHRAELQECFLRDDACAHYPEAVRSVCVQLAALGVDVIRCVTTCPDMIEALRGLRFRHDNEEPVFAWGPSGPATVGRALIDGGHADRAFFQLPTRAEAT